MRALLTAPILVPLLTAAACLLAWRRLRLQQVLGLAGATALAGLALALLVAVHRDGLAVVQVGGWPAPFGISLVADRLSAIMVLAISLVALTGEVYSLGSVDRGRQASGYHPLLFLLVMGACGAVLTGDLFNLYVWIELMLIASFVLIALGGSRAELEGALKYVLPSLLASFLLLLAVGLLYAMTGTLNMADLARRLAGLDRPGLLGAASMLLLVALGTKAAVFPLFFWLPASYHTPPVAVTAIFAGLLTKVGVYALIRVFTLLAAERPPSRLLLVLAGLTMVTGVLGAIAQNEVRRLLAFHIVSQIGYVLMGLGLGTALSLGATIFFVVHLMVAKTALFFVAGAAHRALGSFELDELGGLAREKPLLAGCFLVAALSLAGIPPLSGFAGKLGLVVAGLETREYAIVAVALAVSLLTLYSMMKIWDQAFWKPAPEGRAPTEPRPAPLLVLPIVALTVIAVAMGLLAGPLLEVSLLAGEQLVEPSAYIEAVLGAPT